MTRRTRRKIRLASYLTAGAMVLQFGQACAVVNSVITAGVGSSGLLIDNNGYFLGLFNVCGTPNVIEVDANDVPIGDVQFSEDDLMFGCPAQRIVTAAP
ncbi:MAG: hypothetical protein H6818_17930 [Phycisphaerales bacterium]|nr:hypothetical protein [Phycisphaerales bacterium]MCB9864838.1 hypothetical protein [Phycisphaerales bacterium]